MQIFQFCLLCKNPFKNRIGLLAVLSAFLLINLPTILLSAFLWAIGFMSATLIPISVEVVIRKFDRDFYEGICLILVLVASWTSWAIFEFVKLLLYSDSYLGSTLSLIFMICCFAFVLLFNLLSLRSESLFNLKMIETNETDDVPKSFDSIESYA